MKFPSLLLACLLATAVRASDPAPEPAEARGGVSLAEQTLRDIVARERELFAKAEREGDELDKAAFRGEAQSIATSYDVLLQKNPSFTAAYVAYGLFLGKVNMTRAAVTMLLQANRLDPNIALVKNQLAKHLAEDGRPIEALPYLLSAVDLEPNEPLYHFHLGQLLLAAKDDFLTNGQFTRAGLEKSMLESFQRAASLAPNDLTYAYQYAKVFNEVDPPRWEEALKLWQDLGARPVTDTMRQLIRLQQAHVLLKLGRREEARTVLDGVTDMKLTDEKQTLLDQLAPKAEK